MRLLLAISALMIGAATASAQDYADLKGTWAGTVEGVNLRPDPDQVMADGEPVLRFADVPVTMVIDEQKGRRFAGTISGKTWSKRLVGVFASDNTLLWAEPDGTVQAWLRVDGVLEYCYLDADDHLQKAACAALKRQ